MSCLAQLQRALQANVVNGELAIADAIDSSAEISAATRLAIYSDAYRLRLIEALQANYPILAQFVGDDAFSRMAQEYLAIYPSRHYSVRWFGHRLAEFLSEFPDYRDQVWLNEIATWEWKIATAFDAQDADVLTADDLATLSPDAWPELRFEFHSSAQRVALKTNAAAIVKASTNGDPLPTGTSQAARTEWLIWRQDLTVQYRSLETTEAAALDVLKSGATFGAMCETIANRSKDEEQVPLFAAGFLQRWIADQCLKRHD
jgi:hypothetical protein